MGIQAGQQILHYRLIEKLGEGGMGVVWRAEDTKLHRQVALKVLPEAMAADPERRARFEREARAVAALNHPNIVTLYSVEEADTSAGKVHLITMELVEGRTLTQWLPRDGFPLNRLLEIAIPLADAVSRAHRAGIVHRDLKPDNVMIDAEGRLRVLDFGLAKLHEPSGAERDPEEATVTSDTAEGRVLGTAAYMSPEQAEGKEVDARSDVFSLGTILYEMASGARPFRGETTMSTIGSILKDEPSSITDLKPLLPRHMGRILTRCLAKDPDRRYQTALELRNELEQLKAEVDSGVHATGSPSASVRPRRSWLPALAAIAVVAAIAAVVVRFTGRDETAPAVGTPRPMTATRWYDSTPTWSPDGRLVAFERMTAGNFDIYVKPADGGDAVVRVGGPGDQTTPRWTPDGSHLAYTSSFEPGSPVFLVPADGGRPVRIIDTNAPALSARGTGMGDRPWSSDGRTLLVSLATESGAAVHRVGRATGEARPMTSPPPGAFDVTASYSFDGERIVFERQTAGVGVLMTMPAAGGEPEVLLQDGFSNRYPVWRPDGRRVLFTSSRGAAENIFEIDVVTAQTRQLTFDTRRVSQVSVSGDDRIVYVPWWHDTLLHVVDVETGERRQITSHTLDNFGGRFSPDGRTIAYSSSRTGNFEIWLHHLDGRPETRFTENEHVDQNPIWSPDGERLAFVSDRDGKAMNLYVAHADGRTGARRLLDSTIGSIFGLPVASPIRWSADGESIAYVALGDVGPELWTVGPGGGAPRRRFAGVWEFDWYRGSRHGIATRPRGSETELLAVDLDNGREEVLFVGALQEIDVAPDGSAVAFVYGRGHFAMGLAVLKLEPPAEPEGLPRAVGEPEYVVRTEGTWHVHGGGWSPDSKSFVYTQDLDYGDIYELVEP